jgi:MOSC domain-containing protein
MRIHQGLLTMRVESLWRYPVKSMRGEACDELVLEAHGVAGDRSHGVLDLASGTVISAKRDGRLLEAAARLSSGRLLVKVPDDVEAMPGDALDELLTRWLERPVRLVEAATFGAATYESPEDYERDDSPLERWSGPVGAFVDDSPLHLLTTGELRRLAEERPDLQWDVRRFRPNVVIDDGPLGLCSSEPGDRLHFGDVEVEVTKACSRCVMTTRAQPGDVVRQLEVFRHVVREHDGNVGVRARVVRPGRVRVGDQVALAE